MVIRCTLVISMYDDETILKVASIYAKDLSCIVTVQVLKQLKLNYIILCENTSGKIRITIHRQLLIHYHIVQMYYPKYRYQHRKVLKK